MKFPAYQWYVNDAGQDEHFKLMTYEEQGLYRAMLDHQWVEGSLPINQKVLAKLFGLQVRSFSRLYVSISKCFAQTEDGERLINLKLDAQKRRLEAHFEAKTEAGREGAAKRWGKTDDSTPNGKTIAHPMAHPMGDPMPNDSSSITITNLITSKKKEITPLPPLLDNDAFKEVWEEWIAYRKERRLPVYKPIGLKRALNEIASFADPVDAVVFSISKNYAGVFERKETHTNGNGKHETPRESYERINRELGISQAYQPSTTSG